MLDLHSYALFLATAVVLVLSPGPDTVLILSRTLASGTAAGGLLRRCRSNNALARPMTSSPPDQTLSSSPAMTYCARLLRS